MSMDFSTLRILIVDDQLLVRTLLGQVLRNIGFKPDSIHQGTDGNNALRILALRPVDIILCDVQMEPINGVDLLKEVRCGRTSTPSNVPFVFLSGHPERATILQATKFHADGFIIKPPKPSDIEKNIETALKRTRPDIDPFSYFDIPTGSDYDLRNFTRLPTPPQNHDLDVLLGRFEAALPLSDVPVGAILARDVCASDGHTLLVRGIKLSALELKTLHNFASVYGIDTVYVAHLPQDQLIAYHEEYGL
ncbi:response regulator [Paludibacterium yongneupense]|uniref:response regulator n=1 Tax=Paludibacterium yongneupense TaxID=400061 RepID=UPI00041B9F4E|nr:response regulator [Paludibacterium yongneupense]